MGRWVSARWRRYLRAPPLNLGRTRICPGVVQSRKRFGGGTGGREEMPQTKTINPRLVAQIVSRYIAHNKVAAVELPDLIATVHRTLTELGQPAEASGPLKPAVAINRSYGHDFVICLECGWRGQVLRGHLTTAHATSP